MKKYTPPDWLRDMDRDDYFFLDPDSDLEEARAWWEDLGPWFQDRGYILYDKVYTDRELDMYAETPKLVFSGATTFPYAHIGGDGHCTDAECSLRTRASYPRLVFAQDSQSRHVCIRVIKPEPSDEYKILSFLNEQSKLWTEENFPCIVPVLEILNNGKNYFAVSPRWDGGMEDQLPWFNTNGEVLDLIQCMLTALCYLHSNKIFHRDIHDGNILTNHFGCANMPHRYSSLQRQELRAKGQLVYALTDFNYSLMLPVDTDLRSCRLPIAESYPGVIEKPYGVVHGEVYFNPFAYDVACLGITLSYQFQHLCSSLPILAPLLSGMLTSNTIERFTAQEALAFFDDNRPKIWEYESLSPPQREYIEDWQAYDRWTNVPPHLLKIWSRYRGERPSYFTERIVGRLCQRRWGRKLIFSVRRLLCFDILQPYLRKCVASLFSLGKLVKSVLVYTHIPFF
ncbi:hypothetical protein BDN70DRAFT_849126 [Pholiota conissans]|uniref:Protein kinase domain-containing protein n=1 Tax=Pholiota conissans TaxID=109636 RepID=A0A9P5ZAV6_9AGAR|nr:hypothetical protein BDN70DRAFT_849126 [Pholiota conissans]